MTEILFMISVVLVLLIILVITVACAYERHRDAGATPATEKRREIHPGRKDDVGVA